MQNAIATEAPTGISVESIQRIQPGMTVQEIEDIIGHAASRSVGSGMGFQAGSRGLTSQTTHIWNNAEHEASTNSAQISVSFINGFAYAITPMGLPGASAYTFRMNPMTILNPPTPREPFIGSTASLIIFFIIIVFIFIGIPYLYSLSKPELERNVVIVSRRLRHSWWVRYGNTCFFLSFKTLDTNDVVEFRIPWIDRSIFESANVGDAGRLTSRGSRFIRFHITKRRDENQKVQ